MAGKKPFILVRPFIEEPDNADEFDSDTRPQVSWTVIILIILATLGFTVALFEVLAFQSPTALASISLWSLSLVLLVVLRPRTGSVLLSAMYVGVLTAQIVSLGSLDSYSLVDIMIWDVAGATTSLVALFIVLNMPLRHPSKSRKDISPPFSSPTKDLRSPEDNLTLWQWMSVSWMTSLIQVGSKRQLNEDDVWFLGYEFQHTHLHEAFRALSGTVVWRLLKANWIDLAILTTLAIIELAANLAAPLLLQQLLKAMDFIDTVKRPAITYAALTLAVRFVAAQSAVFGLWFGRRCYERSRGEMITMLHEKVLNRKIVGGEEEEGNHRLSSEERSRRTISTDAVDQERLEDTEAQGLLGSRPKQQEGAASRISSALHSIGSCFSPGKEMMSALDEEEPSSTGKILNIMRSDVYETAQRFWEFQTLINKPLGLVFSTILVWRLIGWSCFVGVAVVLVAQLLNAFFASRLLQWERVRRQATDRKLHRIGQYVEAIRHLRWYGWHLRMLEDIMTARQKELNIKIITYFWDSAIKLVNTFASGVLPVAAFWSYTALAGHQLRIDVAFAALQLFSMLQQNIREIPNLITVLLNASVAVGRIEGFMSEPEIAQNDPSYFANRLELMEASFSWPGVTEEVLHNINLSFPVGLTVVLGPVASGKTALLQALLGELDTQSGQLIKPDSAIAYCAQKPWLQSMSIRENILFGFPYDETRYNRILDSCALLPDLATFEHGDLSPIGENGIGLSGGQMARTALARALYSGAKFIFLDDPLSALDQQTAESIITKCFKSDLLQDRTTILVTHRVDLCQELATQIVEMSNGTARARTQTPSAAGESLDLQQIESPAEHKATPISAAVVGKFEAEEHRAHGGVQLNVYWEYIKAGKLKWWALVIFSAVLWRLLDYVQSWFLKEWGEAYRTAKTQTSMVLQDFENSPQTRSSPLKPIFSHFPDPSINVNPWLLGLLILVVLQAVAFVSTQIIMLIITYSAGKNMFREIMKTISNATFRFYDVTPVGRLLNRMTGDVGTVDGRISDQFLSVSWQVISWVLSVAIIASVTPVFLLFSLVLTFAFVYYFLLFLPTSQSLRRLEMVSLSPLMSNFGALLTGLKTVRAFHVQTQFQNRVIAVTDAFQGMDHFYWSLQSWLQYRFDILSAVSTFILTLLAIYSGVSSGLTAFVLVAAQKFVYSTHILCKQYGQLQLDFVSVERVVELLHLEQEDPGTLNPPAIWPSAKGDVVFEDVTVRYASHLEPALKNISFTIPGGSNTAVIGRTGSGKSTLALTLLATMAPESGRILIDGVDISKVSKQILRTRITFLAQDPILFHGTLRTNLDPLESHTDAECSSVLDRIGGSEYNWRLDTLVTDKGENLSQGQRQLVGLARAILRRSSVVIMDEATASIDFETSSKVQQVLREELRGSTVLTIAHRASAVRGADWVCQLHRGELQRFNKADDDEIE